MPTLLIASNNAHKLQELREILALAGAADVRLLTPRDLGIDIDPEETAPTYAGNALIKARAFCAALAQKRELPSRREMATLKSITHILSDDSGLEVDALDGRPGLLSARYHKAAPNGDGCAALLGEMAAVPAARRSARFRAVMALSTPAGIEQLFEGVCEGSVGIEKRGDHGFGFDPVFMVDAASSMAELAPHAKHAISHRGIAMRAVLNALAR